jgi:flavodoxin
MNRRIIGIILMIGLLSGMTACGRTQSARSDESEITQESQTVESQEDQSAAAQESAYSETESTDSNNALVVYFSCTNTTKGVAETIADVSGATLYEIEAAVPYTAADIDYNDSSSRSTIEQNDSSARPEIAGTIENWEDYSCIFIGFPIWWYEEPRIMDTFIESYDFSGKTIIPFCTSGGSGIGSAEKNLKSLCNGDATWLSGTRLDGGASAEDIASWVDGLGIR